MLGSLQPMLIVWGPEQITLYNDGYAQMCGNRHPAAFGRPFRDLWFDIWDQVDPIITAAYAGQGTSMDDIQFTMYRKGYPEETHFSFSYTPVRDPWGTVLGMFCACSEITAEVLMRREQQTIRERFMQVFELSQGGIAMLSGKNHVFDYANEQYYAMIGNRDIIGKPVADAVPEVVRQGYIDILDGVYRTGEPFVAKGLEVELNRGANGEKQTRIIDLAYQPMRDPDGRIGGILVQALDVTEMRADEKHRELLSHELGHRLKNQLAMVQAIASQTLRSAPDMQTARRTLSDRISVLSYAHDAIIKGGNGSSRVGDLVAQMISLHDDPNAPRITTSGPNLKIGSRSSLSLSLILHELATNALKHGALSVPEGRVNLTWGVMGPHQDRFELVWRESGGPPVIHPGTESSGTRLIRAGLAGTADCKVDFTYAPEGFNLIISTELAGFQQEH
ncbi:sensor histidine kinase [Rhizobium sp. SL42]|uniref:sensor histidine kinase n=1 Tax=Rhizobium sp. SL42 TaxID=2806346 RepID=UPI001F17BDB3|nr:HWE histidine kinase domain-containing protein [Rhizobium sp. SL42]UJW74585.1 PAS domain-containing protein [Rhizobium sp. SL42]